MGIIRALILIVFVVEHCQFAVKGAPSARHNKIAAKPLTLPENDEKSGKKAIDSPGITMAGSFEERPGHEYDEYVQISGVVRNLWRNDIGEVVKDVDLNRVKVSVKCVDKTLSENSSLKKGIVEFKTGTAGKIEKVRIGLPKDVAEKTLLLYTCGELVAQIDCGSTHCRDRSMGEEGVGIDPYKTPATASSSNVTFSTRPLPQSPGWEPKFPKVTMNGFRNHLALLLTTAYILGKKDVARGVAGKVFGADDVDRDEKLKKKIFKETDLTVIGADSKREGDSLDNLLKVIGLDSST